MDDGLNLLFHACSQEWFLVSKKKKRFFHFTMLKPLSDFFWAIFSRTIVLWHLFCVILVPYAPVCILHESISVLRRRLQHYGYRSQKYCRVIHTGTGWGIKSKSECVVLYFVIKWTEQLWVKYVGYRLVSDRVFLKHTPLFGVKLFGLHIKTEAGS